MNEQSQKTSVLSTLALKRWFCEIRSVPNAAFGTDLSFPSSGTELAVLSHLTCLSLWWLSSKESACSAGDTG